MIYFFLEKKSLPFTVVMFFMGWHGDAVVTLMNENVLHGAFQEALGAV